MAAYTDYSGWQVSSSSGRRVHARVRRPHFRHHRSQRSPRRGDRRAAVRIQSAHAAAQRERLSPRPETSDYARADRHPEEAKRAESGKASGRKTWTYQAKNVRDFAFASSRKFAWDAMVLAGEVKATTVLAGASTPRRAVHLVPVFHQGSRTRPRRLLEPVHVGLPVPVCHLGGGRLTACGMEYPMIVANGGGPRAGRGTYTEEDKYGFISLVIHEAGHNYFPMIVNSDERQWTWMDEGLNTFLEYLTGQSAGRRISPVRVIPRQRRRRGRSGRRATAGRS
ncbi:MAG: hypothetical protein IPM46_09785 [Flavobacteriales bacterium]|nr:hypothetical protein [Flavobacteriales bacterium]